jgi:hypothetical protein
MCFIQSTGACMDLQNLKRILKSSMLCALCGLYFLKNAMYLSEIALLIDMLLVDSHLYVAAKAGANFSGN